VLADGYGYALLQLHVPCCLMGLSLVQQSHLQQAQGNTLSSSFMSSSYYSAVFSTTRTATTTTAAAGATRALL
jgi:hypothetical protein